ncbi:MAG: type II toxin-antitoxin system RelE family toxin [Armatimonadota bacterium]
MTTGSLSMTSRGKQDADVYRVELTAKSRRLLKSFAPDIRDRLLRALHELARDPRPPGCKPLSGVHGVYRIRVGDYRIVYEIHDTVLLVVVVTVGHRSVVYKSR